MASRAVIPIAKAQPIRNDAEPVAKVSVHDIDRAHAKLSASGAHMWLHCTASAWANLQFSDTGSEYAEEGTRAHDMAKDCLRAGTSVNEWAWARFCCDYEDVDDEDYPLEMFECVQGYIDYVLEEVAEAKLRNPDAIVYIEQRVDFSPWVQEGFGTADCVIISDGIIRVIDYKHGKGVYVEVEANEQLMMYGLGAWHMFHHLFDVRGMSLTIYQPRVNNIQTWEIDAEQLINWAEEVVKPTAARAFHAMETGDLSLVDFNPMDEEVCRFCLAKVHCRARADEMQSMAKYEKDVALMTDKEIVGVLAKATHLQKWSGDLQRWARERAEKGVRIAGWKLVEGRSNRKITDENAVKTILLLEGFTESQFYKRKLLGLTDMTRLVKGEKKLKTLIGQYITKPKGKPVLVEESDPRPELNDAATTAAEFAADDATV